jgi:hypothetical protein
MSPFSSSLLSLSLTLTPTLIPPPPPSPPLFLKFSPSHHAASNAQPDNHVYPTLPAFPSASPCPRRLPPPAGACPAWRQRSSASSPVNFSRLSNNIASHNPA